MRSGAGAGAGAGKCTIIAQADAEGPPRRLESPSTLALAKPTMSSQSLRVGRVPLSFLSAVLSLALISVIGRANAIQGGTPPAIPEKVCGQISTTIQCDNENQVVQCTPTTTSGALCSYCDGMESGNVWRCLPGGDEDECTMPPPSGGDYSCGFRLTGQCNPSIPECQNATIGIACSSVAQRRCQ